MTDRRTVLALIEEIIDASDSFPNLEGMEAAFMGALGHCVQQMRDTIESVDDLDIHGEVFDELARLLSESKTRIDLWDRSSGLHDLDLAHQIGLRAISVLGLDPQAAVPIYASESQESVAVFLDKAREEFQRTIESATAQSAVAERQIDTLRRDANKLVADAQDVTSQLQAYHDETESVRDQIIAMRDLVTKRAVAGAYENKARDEEATANRWRLLSIVAILSTVAIAVFLLASTSFDDVNIFQFSGKIALALPVATLAAYAGRQSSEHRFVQREIEHTAMQLTYLRPFLQDVGSDKLRDEVVMRLADQIIGRPRRTASSAAEDQ